MAGHKVTIEIEVPDSTLVGGHVTWGQVRELVRQSTPMNDNLRVGFLSGAIYAQGSAGYITVNVRELHG